MEASNHNRKKLLLGTVILFLFLPIIQDLTHFWKIKPLDGVIEKVESPDFTSEAWFERQFQEGKERYLEQEFGLRNFLVRLHNQLCFWIYKEAHAKWVVVGKENYLYESGYLDAYFGRDFIGEEKIKEQAARLKFIQDTLRKLNKNLIVVVTPGKASYFPEYIPKEWQTEKARTNYEAYRDNFNACGVNYLDFSRWFDNMKGKSAYPLYPQYGVHWSVYGAALALDSIIKNVEALRRVDLPDFRIASCEIPDTLRSPDDDVYKGMNLLFQPETYKMAYPILDIKEDSTKTKPSLLVIGDSYFWNINNLWVTGRVFSNYRFCFYYHEVYTDTAKTSVAQLNMKEEINKSDVILIVVRNADLQRIGWGFIDDAHTLYSKNN